jgi:hypothetical protein
MISSLYMFHHSLVIELLLHGGNRNSKEAIRLFVSIVAGIEYKVFGVTINDSRKDCYF